MSDTILPVGKPGLLFLHRTSPPLLTPRHIGVRPDALDDLVLLGAGEDLGNIGEETVDLVRVADHDAAMGEREGDGDVAPVGGAGEEGEQTSFEIGCVPIYDCAFEREAISRQLLKMHGLATRCL